MGGGHPFSTLYPLRFTFGCRRLAAMLERWGVEVTFLVWSPGFSQAFQLPPSLSLAPLEETRILG